MTLFRIIHSNNNNNVKFPRSQEKFDTFWNFCSLRTQTQKISPEGDKKERENSVLPEIFRFFVFWSLPALRGFPKPFPGR